MKNYTRPTVIEHGAMVSLTKGPCACLDEGTSLRSAAD